MRVRQRRVRHAARGSAREFVEMKSVLASLVAVGGCLVIFSPSAESGSGNPSPTGTGQPNQSCQTLGNNKNPLPTPGNTANSPGSVFNEPGFGMNGTSTLGGQGGQSYNGMIPGKGSPPGANAQYDVACYHQLH